MFLRYFPSLLFSAFLFIAGCGEENATTIIKPDDSVPSAAEMEAFYNQAPEEGDVSKD